MFAKGKCSICGRELSRPGRHLRGIGEVGPECYRKWAAFEAWAARLGLLDAFYGGVFVPRSASSAELSRVHRGIMGLRVAGLEVAVRHTEAGALVEVTGVSAPKAFQKAIRKATEEMEVAQ